jgi:hypothetical protein
MTDRSRSWARTVSVSAFIERRKYRYRYAYVPRIRIWGVSGVYLTGSRYSLTT